MDIFNTREIAVGIWLLVFAVFVVSIRSIRESLPTLLNAFFEPKILTPIFLLLIYVVLIVFVLYETGIWSPFQLKNTTIWLFSVALPVDISNSSGLQRMNNFFQNKVKNSFKLVAVLEFVIAFYTFPLLVELMIVPVVTFFSDTTSFFRNKTTL